MYTKVCAHNPAETLRRVSALADEVSGPAIVDALAGHYARLSRAWEHDPDMQAACEHRVRLLQNVAVEMMLKQL